MSFSRTLRHENCYTPGTPLSDGKTSLNSAYLYLATVLIWGTTWYVIKLQLGVVDPVVSVFYRFAIAAIILMLWCGYRRLPLRFPLRAHAGMFFLGLFLFSTNYVVFYIASEFVTTGLVAVTFSTIVIFNIVNGALLLGNRVSLKVIVGALIGVCGIALVFLPSIDTFHVNGITLCFLGTLLASFGNIASARNQRFALPVIQANAWGMTYGTLILLLVILILDLPFGFDPSATYVLSLLYLAIFGSILAFGGYLTLVGRVGPERAAYATVLFPIVALVISTVLEGYQWTFTALTGVVLVLAGNYVIARQAH